MILWDGHSAAGLERSIKYKSAQPTLSHATITTLLSTVSKEVMLPLDHSNCVGKISSALYAPFFERDGLDVVALEASQIPGKFLSIF